MQRLMWIMAALVALYGGYWVVGSRAALSGAEQALARMKADGLAEYGSVSIAGFPSRFDITVTDPAFRAPDGRWGWKAAFLQVLALSYRPNHVIAALPDSQTLATPAGPATLTGTGFRASAVLGVSTTLPLDHAQLVGEGPVLDAASWSLAAESLRAAIRKAMDGTPDAYDVALELPGLAPRGEFADTLAPLADPANPTGRVALSATITLDGPLDRSGDRRRVLTVDLTGASIFWGRLDLATTGTVGISPEGVPEGRLELRARNWKRLLDFLIGKGLIDARTAPTVKAMLGQLALASGDPETLSLPLVFAAGRMSLGPVPLGPAPQF